MNMISYSNAVSYKETMTNFNYNYWSNPSTQLLQVEQ